MSWSSGKDSVLALQVARGSGELEVVGLLTTMNSTADRVAMHAVRRSLLEAQADSLGLPLHVVDLPWPCSNELYEQRMAEAVGAAVAAGVELMVFGDLFLADVRAYREQMLAGTGISPVFPLWQRPTGPLSREMLDAGIRAGRWYDVELLAQLPEHVDPCGENGEFHTFVIDGPGFSHPLEVEVGDVVERDGFVFADVIPTGTASPSLAAT
jgi:diphthamide synthase (EF-2-diphthine--ammonia ligase)